MRTKGSYLIKPNASGLDPTPLNLLGLEVRFRKVEQMIRKEQEARKQWMK